MTMRRPGLAILLALAFAGCSSPPATQAEDSTTGPADPDIPTPVRIKEYAGNLTFRQSAALVCPLYIEGPSESSALALRLGNATEFQFWFEWTAQSPPFQGAIIGLAGERTTVGGGAPSVRGRSVLEWHMDAAQLHAFGDRDALLHIVGPDCPEDAQLLQHAVSYTQTIHYWGNVTYPA